MVNICSVGYEEASSLLMLKKSMMIPSKCTFVFRLSIYSRYLEHSDPIHVDLTIIPIVTNRFKRSVFGGPSMLGVLSVRGPSVCGVLVCTGS